MVSTPRPENIGILGIEVYFPKKAVEQVELEKFDNVSAGKYTIGLGQDRMAIVSDREDINSICLTVVQNLLDKYNISPLDIGRLEVGTETIIDKSKSVKSVLMQLFADSGNTAIEGIDTTNACYGGTNALFNTINWVESSSWDGRYGIVVAGDIAVYKSGNARPTGGCGVVAMLIGPNAPLVFDVGLRATHMEHTWDFYKPDLHSEFPEVDGPLTVVCFLRAVDKCYQRYLEKAQKVLGIENPTINSFDYYCFHSPYTKLVQKSFGRFAFNDFLRNQESPEFAAFEQFKGVNPEDTYFTKEIEKGFMDFTKVTYKSKVTPSLTSSKNIGNMYCGSVYFSLVSLLSEIPSDALQGKRVVLFSYGSGLASSMFSLTVRGSTSDIVSKLGLLERLKSRTIIQPSEYEDLMSLREKTHNVKNYNPIGSIEKDSLFPGTFYLTRVDEKFRRFYERTAK
ncbi:Hydroxymethylglutaryl-CoA synthase, cytoplasmic [Nowakowskiella sp. JEL0407]|nr:Hydroxymethylglutaryl-CoA synthase, cytoplasmic [Nowakowskiella sp. JEL0407]